MSDSRNWTKQEEIIWLRDQKLLLQEQLKDQMNKSKKLKKALHEINSIKVNISSSCGANSEEIAEAYESAMKRAWHIAEIAMEI